MAKGTIDNMHILTKVIYALNSIYEHEYIVLFIKERYVPKYDFLKLFRVRPAASTL
jgi:hypothetical protein